MKNKKAMVITVVLVLVLVIGGVSVFAVTQRTSQSGVNPKPVATTQGTTGAVVGNSEKTPTNSAEVDALVKELSETELSQDQLDIEEDTLELSYHNGEIDLAAYQTKMKELEKEERTLEKRENELEKQLRNLGYREPYADDDYDGDYDYDDYDDVHDYDD